MLGLSDRLICLQRLPFRASNPPVPISSNPAVYPNPSVPILNFHRRRPHAQQIMQTQHSSRQALWQKQHVKNCLRLHSFWSGKHQFVSAHYTYNIFLAKLPTPQRSLIWLASRYNHNDLSNTLITPCIVCWLRLCFCWIDLWRVQASTPLEHGLYTELLLRVGPISTLFYADVTHFHSS